MTAERDVAAATPPGADHDATAVQAAVEQFIARHSAGERPDPGVFAQNQPEPLRAAVLAQCREFLLFDGLLGHQPWQDPPPTATAGDARRFGDFEIQEELGRGGMGIVYLARQRSLNRRVALKVMQSGLTLSKRHVERFRREAAAAAQLRHPGIVAVHALTEVDGTFALAMDYVAGRNLADILDDLRLQHGKDGPIDGSLGLAKEKGYVAECALFAAQLAAALSAAHQANVVHRDLKPRNLMLDDRRQVRLLDFGLAKSLGEGSISMSGEITGTAHYMSPEQTLAKRVEVDHRSDLWALGVILYEMLTLARPFDGKNLQQIVYAICFQEPAPIQRLNPKVPRDLVTIVHKALEKDPQKRYQSAADFEADLQRFLRWEPIHARPAGALSRMAKFLRRNRTGTALGAIALVAGLVALGFHWQRGLEADRLLAAAAAHSAQGQHDDAKRLASQALALRNDDTTRALSQAYSSRHSQIIAEALVGALNSKRLIEYDREHALAEALAAERMHSSLVTRSAVLEALGSGSSVRRLGGDRDGQRLYSLRCSPDGRSIALAGYDGLLELWPTAGGEPLVLVGHNPKAPVIDIAFLDDDRLVSVGIDRTLRAFRRSDGALLATIALWGNPAGLCRSEDGSRLLIVCYQDARSHQTQAYDTATLQPVGEPKAHETQPVVDLSHDGSLAATSTGTIVHLWSVADGSVRREVATAGKVRALAFAPDSALLAVASDTKIRLLRCRDGVVVGQAEHSREVDVLCFDPSGERLLSGARDLTARLWQLAPQGDAIAVREVATLIDHKSDVQHVAFSADGQLALTGTGGQRGELRVFDVGVGGGALVQRFEVGPSILSAGFSPDGRSVLAHAGPPSRALLWDRGENRGVITIRQPTKAEAVRFDATGQRLATGASDERLRVWSTADGTLRWHSDRLGQPQTTLDLDARGERVASASRFDGVVHVHRLADGERLYQLRGHGQGVHALRFCGNGSQLMTAGVDPKQGGLAVIWNANDWSAQSRVQRPSPIVAADVTADGSMLATVEGQEDVVRFWSLPGGVAAGTIKATARSGPVHWSADGKLLLLVVDGRCLLVDREGAVQQTFAGDRAMRWASFGPDDQSVLTGSDGTDPEALLFAIADGNPRLRFKGHRGAILHGGWSPRGDLCATSARDGTVCIWPTDPVAAARGRLPEPAPTTK